MNESTWKWRDLIIERERGMERGRERGRGKEE